MKKALLTSLLLICAILFVPIQLEAAVKATNSEQIQSLNLLTQWNVVNGPLELSGITHYKTNEFICVSDSNGGIYSFNFDFADILKPENAPKSTNFRLLANGIGWDLEGCVIAFDKIWCVNEGNSKIYVVDPDKFVKERVISTSIRNFVSNCGLESLAYLSESEEFVTCIEQPIDAKSNGIVDLSFFKLNHTTTELIKIKTIPYQIDKFEGKNIYRNGISEITAWDADTLLIVERAVDLGQRLPKSRIRIYAIDTDGMSKSQEGKPISKRLVYEYNSSFLPCNIEGLCRVPNTNLLLAVQDLPSMCCISVFMAQ